MEGNQILIVEDEPITAEDLKLMVGDLGYSAIEPARTGRDARDKIEKYRPDLVLMDIRLPGESDGIKVARQTRDDHEYSLVYVTAQTDEEMLNRVKETQPDGVITKPISDVKLKKTLHALLEENGE